ncbi:hypothetical protein GRI39_00925 [Altererythrobacter indicus]|uniref:DUF1570 domain-containing protein n=1 Tax=Altericroceibacterium indicum TaxID=374177 RepID=A0A845A359_9SPHN|nr:hypothetical protein [Altericroceibacterium indicum]MXP24610.1 hypothetical protein [Altericroceibacterium indicum]
MRKIFKLAGLVLTGFGFMQPAHAKWREASSEHFVIYADEREHSLRRFTESLENFHAALKLILATEPDTPSPSNRVTIYQVDSQKDVRELIGSKSRYIQGFYVPSAGGSLAIVPDGIYGGKRISSSMSVLLHEYAHHFQYAASTAPPVKWLTEGSAEFWAAASFERDGTVNVGGVPMSRAHELLNLPKVPIEQLLDSDLYEANRGRSYDSFYGRSWLLYHYLIFNKERQGQLMQYMRLVRTGTPSLEAGKQAFGDLDQLEKELSAYLMSRRMKTFSLKPGMLEIGDITIRELRDGEAAIMPTKIVSKTGVDEESAQEVLMDARKIAARFPDDAVVLAELSEAELDAGNIDQAVASADAAIGRDDAYADAYVRKIFMHSSRRLMPKECATHIC